MAKISYRRLAGAMVKLLDTHELSEVAAAAAQVMAAGNARHHLERLLPELERELARSRGHIVIHAITARQLPGEVLDRLSAELTKQLKGVSYELDTHINPGVVGGARFTTADESLDLTLEAQLQHLRISHG
ncbi:MAG TPA: F0F1 ATP synthase subunit delta [Candidatus Polarisedimenticolaceae bacterium]|nr:F0F1 ATP synthase subunit delta [Candidatus Polarisedimenticolaceae bacterium]